MKLLFKKYDIQFSLFRIKEKYLDHGCFSRELIFSEIQPLNPPSLLSLLKI